MEREEILSKVAEVVAEQLNVEEADVVEDASFIDDLGADSLDIVELVMALEEAFGVSIPDQEAENIKTVGDAVEFIKANA
jgi:acyl carrier protein